MKVKHVLDYCDGCETEMVTCGTCGNNCCNGGYGEINGAKCPDCPAAYDAQDFIQKFYKSLKLADSMSRGI
jgi:hypothetical protein